MIKQVFAIVGAALLFLVLYMAYGYVQMRGDLFRVYDAPEQYRVSFSEDADLTIVDFSSFGCVHCRDLHPALMEALARDGRVSYVPRIVTSPDAPLEAAIAASVYAAAFQGQMRQMYDAIYQSWPVEKKGDIFDIATALGLDTQQLSRDMTRQDVVDYVDENRALFSVWNTGRVPTLLLGKTLVYAPRESMPDADILLEKFSQARR